ncbi:MAG: hypothetical protein V4534_07875 [Myxococcota bacterium]
MKNASCFCLVYLIASVAWAEVELFVDFKRTPDGALISARARGSVPKQQLILINLVTNKTLGIGFVNEAGELQFPSVLVAIKDMTQLENGRHLIRLGLRNLTNIVKAVLIRF